MPEQPPFICEICGGAHSTSEHFIFGNDSKEGQNVSTKVQNEPTTVIPYERFKGARDELEKQKRREELKLIVPRQRAVLNAKSGVLSGLANKYGFDYDSVETHIEDLIDETEVELDRLRRENPFAESGKQLGLRHDLKELKDDLKICHEAYDGYRELEQELAGNEEKLED